MLPWGIWVTTSLWEVITAMRNFILDLFHRTLSFSQHRGKIFAFKYFVKTVNPSKHLEDIFPEGLWDIYFNCSLSKASYKLFKNNSSRGFLEWLAWYHCEMSINYGGYHVYNDVYAGSRTSTR